MGEGYARVELAGALAEWRAVAGEARGAAVPGLTATVTGGRGYGEAWHVTFPPAGDLDLWVAAVGQAWREAEARRAGLIAELPEWMRPGGARPAGLRVVVRGKLRCGKPLTRDGVRPATVLAEAAQFPGLDAETVCRAQELWARARRGRL